MMNKIIKFLMPIIVMMLVFFINKLNVFACGPYYTYQSYIDSNGNKVNWQELNNHPADLIFPEYVLIWDNQFWNVVRNGKILESFYSTEFETCPEYVKVSISEGKTFLSVTAATESEYTSYIKTQYDNIATKFSETSSIYYVDNLFDYISQKTMVFSSKSTSISNSHYNELVRLTSEDDVSKLDLNSKYKNNPGIDKFYEATKSRWINIVDKYLSEMERCGDIFSSECRSGAARNASVAFLRWFNLVKDYAFEDSYSIYLDFYKFAHLWDYTDEDDFNDQVEALTYIIAYDKNMDWESQLQSNNCLALCNYPDNIVTRENCMKTESYKNCSNAKNYCDTLCSSVRNTPGYSSCINSCIPQQMGESNYNQLQITYQNVINNIINEREDLLDSIRYSLSNIEAPSIEGIEFKPYEVKCEDVVVFHIIYRIMTIAAPILVILLGSIDYAKAVFSSDEKKMQESKKKFPKRIALLVLFVAIPTIISIIMGFSGGETNLMKCVILGE